MKIKTLGAALAVVALSVASLGAGEAEARHGRKAAIIAGGVLLGLGLAAAASRPRYYDDGYARYDDYYDDDRYGYGAYDYGPPRGYSRQYYDDDYGPYDYPDHYARERIKRRHFSD